MNNRANKLKRKVVEKRNRRKVSPHEKNVRERMRERSYRPISSDPYFSGDTREDTSFESWDGRKLINEEKNTSFIKKDLFMMQILASICFFIVMGIFFQSPSASFQGVRNYVEYSFQEDFEFNALAHWYEDAFGRPLALLPPEMDVVAPGNFEKEREDIYALPASGVIRQSFDENGRGIYVETDIKEEVEAIRGGMVRFVGVDEEGSWDKVVVVRHYDGGESWYGMLENISVQLYDHVESGDVLGEVSPHEEKDTVGVYYFALKQGDTFIDPTEVISFD